MKKIFIITGSRSEFSLMKNLIIELKKLKICKKNLLLLAVIYRKNLVTHIKKFKMKKLIYLKKLIY